MSNKIAAGEVVERPASVVKELLENSIDAEGTKVLVEIVDGGRSLIRVSDNGIGMSREDALLCVERHATSKISKEEDLFCISTLGFRGEALPSIASVSDMEIVTRTDPSETGTRVVVTGGKVAEVEEVGAPRGTMVSVKRLFFNTPARRKFLKTDQTEMGHISDVVTRVALALPGVGFKFFHNGRALGNWSGAGNLLHRIVDTLGIGLKDRLYEVDLSADGVWVKGYAASPEISRTTSRALYLYVNGRFVNDKVLMHGVKEAYSQHLVKGKFPLVVLFLNIPAQEVDVNVHPTKSSVRFAAPKKVHDAVMRGVAGSLRHFDRPGWGQAPVRAPLGRPKQGAILYRPAPAPGSVREPITELTPVARGREPGQAAALFPEKRFSSLRILGQLHDTYIVCESEDGMVLIDQHAAHERVVFESLKSAYNGSSVATQGLLVPETLELGHREADILEGLVKGMKDMGIEIEHFGGGTYIVKSVPALLAGKPVKPLVLELVEKAAELGVATELYGKVDECLAVMACHAAIRANQRLAVEQMRALLRQLDEIENPSRCPHGRPTYVHWPLRGLEKDFKRVV